VLFGGGGQCVAFNCPTFNDTWEYDGLAWTQRTTSPTPPARTAAMACFDTVRNRIVLTGGQGNCIPACGTTFDDVWEWNGVGWAVLPQSPRRVHSAGLAFDAALGASILFGGVAVTPLVTNQPSAETLAFGAGGNTVLVGSPMPVGPGLGALVADEARQRIVAFGSADLANPGTAATWEWGNRTWQPRTLAGQPPARTNHALAYDASRQRVVLFGGTANSGGFLADTWEFDGVAWQQVPTPAAPPPQYSHELAFDRARGVTVLYPGAFGRNELWEYNGVLWTLRPLAMPPFRYFASLGYDQRRARTVLFGGFDSQYREDTWEYDGASWVQVAAAAPPPARSYGAMTWDPVRARLVLFGGSSPTGAPLGDLWEYDGAQWTPRSATNPPAARIDAGLAWDRALARLVLFGGGSGAGRSPFRDTWELRVGCDRAGPGQVAGGGPPCACTTPPSVGGNWCVAFGTANPSALTLLLVGFGECAGQPSVLPPPVACAPSYLLQPAPATVVWSQNNPATFCFAIPAHPMFLGTSLCVQGAGLEGGACLRFTDGLVVVVE
jgi:hypothetical protein